MKYEIKTDSGSILEIDEDTGLSDMQNAEYKFFKNPHGKRETFDTYRGQLIVRHTTTFTQAFRQVSERRTVVYLFVREVNEENKDNNGIKRRFLLCASSGNAVSNLKQAEKLIDRIIAEKRFAYNMDAKNESTS
jgi:hypothetical protein